MVNAAGMASAITVASGQSLDGQAATGDGLCKEGRENTTWCENAGFAVLILTKRHIIKGGICADISRFRLSLLGNTFSVENQILANLQEL